MFDDKGEKNDPIDAPSTISFFCPLVNDECCPSFPLTVVCGCSDLGSVVGSRTAFSDSGINAGLIGAGAAIKGAIKVV